MFNATSKKLMLFEQWFAEKLGESRKFVNIMSIKLFEVYCRVQVKTDYVIISMD